MARSSTFPSLTGHMILLLVGVLLISVPLYTYYPSFGGPSSFGSPSTHSRILTEESPVFRFNVTPPSSSVEISSLHSNDTPVALLVRGSTNVLFNATNITSLEGYPVEVARDESDLWVEVVRLRSDANITITVTYWTDYTITAPPPPALNLAPLFGSVLSVCGSVGLMLTAIRHGLSKRITVGATIAVILILLGTSCCYPLVRIHLQHDFDPVYTSVTLPDQEYSFLLNETHPSSFLNLSSLFSGNGTGVRYKVHSIISDNYPVKLAISNEDEFAFVLEEECQNGDWWFPIYPTSNQLIVFNFDRVDSDAEVTLRVGIKYRTLLPGEDITLPADLCAIGIAVMAFGLGLTVMVDRYSSSESSSSKDRPQL